MRHDLRFGLASLAESERGKENYPRLQAVLMRGKVVSIVSKGLPKADLIVMNENKLEGLNIPEHSIRAFMRNFAYPLSVKTCAY